MAQRTVVAPLHARGWGYRYPSRHAWAVSDLDVHLPGGAFVALAGASGSGKSTVLAALAGVLPPGETRGEIAAPERIGLVQQDPDAGLVMATVADEIAFGLANLAVPASEIAEQCARAASLVALPADMGDATATLSGGTRQLLALASAVACEPELLLLDEPTANLDPVAAQKVRDAVARVHADTGCTVVLVEHRMARWSDLVTHQVELGSRIPPTAAPEFPPCRPPGEVLLSGELAAAGRLAATTVQVRRGEVVAITGPPGSGKTTLLLAAGGLVRPGGGAVTWQGTAGAPWDWRADELVERIGNVLQNPEHQFLAHTVRGELEWGLSQVYRDRVEPTLAALGLAELAAAHPFTLSGGQQRRLSVAAAVIRRPPLLVLDEPTYGQDPESWAALLDMLAAHRDSGGAVLMATHDPETVQALGAREVRLEPVAPVPRAPWRPRVAWHPLVLLTCAGVLSALGVFVRSTEALLLVVAAVTVATIVVGMPVRRAAAYAVPVAVSALGIGVANALLSGSPDAAAVLPAAVRVLAIGLPGVFAAAVIDPAELADALVHRLRVPPRFAYSALAALRMIPLLRGEWETLGVAARARGASRTSVFGRLRDFPGRTFRLLAASLRRAERMAVAMQARALTDAPRTAVHPLPVRPADIALIAGSATVVAAVVRLT